MALGYNDRQRLLGLPENENADMDNLVEAPEFQQFQNAQDSSEEMPVLAQPERQFAQSTALENSSSVAPINEESDIPVQTRVPAATDVSAQVKSKDQSTNSSYNKEAGETPSLMKRYEDLLAERKAAMQEAQRSEMIQSLIGGIGQSLSKISAGGIARNVGAKVTPNEIPVFKQDVVGNVQKQYNPEVEAMLNQYKLLQGDKERENSDKLKAEEMGLKRLELGLKARELADKKAGTGSLSLTKGQEAADKKAGEFYANYIKGGGRARAEQSLKNLKALYEEIKADQGFIQAGGTRHTWIPDSLRDRDSIRRRSEAVSFAMEGLKNTFGGQGITDSERKALAESFYNDQLPNKDNAKILARKIEALEKDMEADRKMAKEFQQRGTISQYNLDNNTAETTDTSNEVERLVPNENGVNQSAIFDKNTKQFLRWK